jgi:hypothetical protein
VIGEDLDPYAQDLAVPGRGDLAGHVVVAGEGGAHQVLGAVLHPLHGPPGDDRADDRADVTRVDADLVAETAADVGGDDPDLVLGNPGHHRVEGAVGVRGLGGGVEGEFAVDRVHGGDRAARLQRGRVDARVEHGLLDHDVGPREHLVGGRAVARLPVEDVVVRTALQVVPDDGRAGVQAAGR